ncbi:MAG: endonuclease III [Desulfurococcales archaeon]|nr:endonuclease III [Desulfurococcales archaeon]
MGGARICYSGRRLMERLESAVEVDPSEYVVHVADGIGGPFLVLVGIILSQNTSDKNSIAALKEYVEKIGPRPEDALRAGPERIMGAIRRAGGYRRKAEAIVESAKKIVERGGEEWLLKADPSEVREVLSKVRGVGPKTIDVFMAFTGRERVFPVDTHAMRIAWRWGLTRSPKAQYREASRALAELFEGEDYERAHKLLIAFGRRYCTARNPRCEECPLRDCCPYARGLLRPPSRGRGRGRGRS